MQEWERGWRELGQQVKKDAARGDEGPFFQHGLTTVIMRGIIARGRWGRAHETGLAQAMGRRPRWKPWSCGIGAGTAVYSRQHTAALRHSIVQQAAKRRKHLGTEGEDGRTRVAEKGREKMCKEGLQANWRVLRAAPRWEDAGPAWPATMQRW